MKIEKLIKATLVAVSKLEPHDYVNTINSGDMKDGQDTRIIIEAAARWW